MKFKSEYSKMLFHVVGNQLVFSMKYLPKLTEIEVNEEEDADSYGSTGFRIITKGEHEGYYLMDLD